MLIALDFALGPAQEIVIAGDPKSEATRTFLRALDSRFLPNTVRLLHPLEGREKSEIESLAPFAKNQLPVKGEPAVYVCKNHVCQFPVTEMKALEKLL